MDSGAKELERVLIDNGNNTESRAVAFQNPIEHANIKEQINYYHAWDQPHISRIMASSQRQILGWNSKGIAYSLSKLLPSPYPHAPKKLAKKKSHSIVSKFKFFVGTHHPELCDLKTMGWMP